MPKKSKNQKKVSFESKPTGNFSLGERLYGFWEMMRPMEWSKSLLNMSIALLMAFYVYNVPTSLGIFVAGFFSVALLWSGLYTLNDFTDWKIDLLHATKKKRPIPSGRVTPMQALTFSVILILISFFIAFLLNNALLVGCLLVMLLNQWLYTSRPFRFKERKGLDMISGSMINPIFRYLAGLFLFVTLAETLTSAFPVLPVLIVLFFQSGGYALYRLSSKGHDKKVNMKSTAASLPQKLIKKASHWVIAFGFIGVLFLFINNITFQNPWVGYVPLYFLAGMIPIIFAIPTMRGVLRTPAKATAPSTYSKVYCVMHATTTAVTIVFLAIHFVLH
ncbi:4-hydroxybenzoate octaprenyltransferase [uncultured archaeon]|nr:4-hydroxybenzoate octaprenyltransferase [uncultured archaeon]